MAGSRPYVVSRMAHIGRLLKRGWNIFTKQGILSLASRSIGFVREAIESEVLGRIAKRNAPIEYYGVLLPLDMEVFDNRVRHAFHIGSYEAAEVELIDRYLSGPYDVVDLGASTGFSTVYALDRLGEQSRGVAVEANPDMLEVIDSVRELNEVNFEVEHAAYRPGQSVVTFHIHKKTVSGSTKQPGEREVTVPGVTLADITAKYDLNEFVCLADIEGGEIDLARNELDILEENCKLIIVELHEMDGIAVEARQRFAQSNFEFVDNIGDVYVYRNRSL